MRIPSALLCLFICFCLGCSTDRQPHYRGGGGGSTADLAQLKHLSADSSGLSDNASIANIRQQALQETAMSIGAQSALAWRSKQINVVVEKQDANLRRIFNFNALLLRDNVLPPVLVEGRDTLKIDDTHTIRLADRTYKILSQARFVTSPPTWRDYLNLNYQQPPRPDNTLLPRNAAEHAIWNKYVEIGWHEGIRQANTIFDESLSRLKRDYKGMALYRALLAQNMVSMPFVAKAQLGVTGGGENLRINDQVLRITALPALQANSKAWKPAMSPGFAPKSPYDPQTRR